MFQMRPDKWSSNSRLPLENDIVLFAFTEANYAKEKVNWKLGSSRNIIHEQDFKNRNFKNGKADKECQGCEYCVFDWRVVHKYI